LVVVETTSLQSVTTSFVFAGTNAVDHIVEYHAADAAAAASASSRPSFPSNIATRQ
jgi:hypothetical protein